jgi:hypothetical protein
MTQTPERPRPPWRWIRNGLIAVAIVGAIRAYAFYHEVGPDLFWAKFAEEFVPAVLGISIGLGFIVLVSYLRYRSKLSRWERGHTSTWSH